MAATAAALLLSQAGLAEAKKKKKAAAETPPPAAPAHPKLPNLEDEPASGPSVVAVVLGASSGEEQAAPALLGAVESAVRTSGRPLNRLADALDASGTAARAEATKKGNSQLKAANGAYNEGDLEICGDLGARAETALLQSDLTRTFPRLVRAWVLELASDASQPAKAGKVKSDLEQLLAAAPSVELPAGLLPDDAASQVEPTRSRLKAASTGALQVTSQPSGAQVYVDGAFRGATPLSLSDLTPGGHTVVAFAPGTSWVVKHVTTPGEASLSIPLSATPEAAGWPSQLDALRKSFHSAGVTGPAAQVATLAHADQALVVGLETRGGALQAMAVRVDGKGGGVLADLEATLPSAPEARAAAVRELVAKALASDHQASSHRLGGSPPPAEAPTKASTASNTPPPAASKPASEEKPKERKPPEDEAPTTKAAPAETATPSTNSVDAVRKPPKDLGDDIRD